MKALVKAFVMGRSGARRTGSAAERAAKANVARRSSCS